MGGCANSWRQGLALLGFCLMSGFSVSAQKDVDGCVDAASARFRVPASLIRAVLDVEGGKMGRVSYNANGSYDIGPMQINSLWLPEVERRGGSLQLLLDHRCANVHFGTWLLSRELDGMDPARIDRPSFWRVVGNYHSHTPEFNARYAEKVWLAWKMRSAVSRPTVALAAEGRSVRSQ
jgi:hypothetical protein